MEIAGEYTFDAPREMVWNALNDPAVLGAVMPGGQGFVEAAENEYTGVLNVKVGPVQGKFDGIIKLFDIVELESYKMDVDGKGAPGFVKATGGLTLIDQGEQTHMVYAGEARVGGRIASVGQRLLDASAKSIIRQSLDGLNEYLKAQIAAQQAMEAGGATHEEAMQTVHGAQVSGYTPPSQATVAVNLARDVAKDLVPEEYRPLVVAVALMLVVLLLCRLGCRRS